jgi:hypothetical protein
MPDSRTTSTLDQLAARITTHREQNPPQVAALLDYEQTFMTNLLATFPELDPAQLGGVLLFVGAQLADLAANLPEQMRPNSAPIVVNVVQMAGERLYTGKPPATWACPYTLVGGAVCTTSLTARDEEQLEPRIAGHLEMNHPDTRRERRAPHPAG